MAKKKRQGEVRSTNRREKKFNKTVDSMGKKVMGHIQRGARDADSIQGVRDQRHEGFSLSSRVNTNRTTNKLDRAAEDYKDDLREIKGKKRKFKGKKTSFSEALESFRGKYK